MKKPKRESTVIKTSILSILANLVLVGFKAAVGFISNSIAIITDAVNNLSDALSSIITIIGTKLAGKAPDRNHPFGHGRIEYVTSLVVSAIVLYAGITALIESIKKLINPRLQHYHHYHPRRRHHHQIRPRPLRQKHRQEGPLRLPHREWHRRL